MTTINPYLSFNDNCEEAFNFYKSVFGGEFLQIVRFKDVPSEQPMPEGEGEKIMHVSLPIGQGTTLMASDTPEAFGKVTTGNNFSISIHPDSEEEATNLFNGLSAGGRVTMPLQKTFWNAYFGMFVDKFGIQWMVNYDYDRQK
ncbi:MAG: VOC family protein [Pseudomonadota bacterium]|nr:VOC family protein [Pseudomonadota bacterium]